jgi:hypothetical protein
MTSPLLLLVLVAAGTVGISITAAAALRVWRDWLDLRRRELDRARRATPTTREIAELRRRIRHLESIADGDR